EQGLAGAQRYRTNLHVDLIEQSTIVELPREITASHDPDISTVCSVRHLPMHGLDLAAHESDIRACWCQPQARREYPRRLLVWPRARLTRFCLQHVAKYPFVRGGAHHKCANVTNEARITGVLNIAERKEPVE